MGAVRHGTLVTGLDMQVADRSGRAFRALGRSVAADMWYPYTALQTHHVLLEWELEGRRGFGALQEAFPVQHLARERGREAAARMARAITAA
jgi:hypothetical protein